MARSKLSTKLTRRSKNGKFADGRLTRDEQIRVVQWCIELKTNRQIAALIKDEFGKTISPQAIWTYRHRRKWKGIIKRLRARFEKNILQIPIANKADRLRLLQKVIDEGFKWTLKTVTPRGEEIYELKLGTVTQALKEAREEVEPRGNGKGTGTKIINIVYGHKLGSDDSSLRRDRTGQSVPCEPDAGEGQ